MDDTERLKEQLEGDFETLYKLIMTFGPPVSASDIRAASAILRRWLTENLFGRLCNQLSVVPSFPTIDNTHALGLVMGEPRVEYFATGGIKFAGVPISFPNSSSAPPEEALPFQSPSDTLLRSGQFLRQKRLYFEGCFFTTEEIIRFTANKLGGVHLDNRLNDREQVMLRASEFMTFGGPPEIARGVVGKTHLVLEPNSVHVLSGFHVETVAAAASFLQVHLDGTQLTQLPELKPKLWAKLFGKRKPNFRLYERP